ncbi:MAG: D-alanine--D-alanine ligase [Alphaproteobacteria bacterium]
MTKHVAVLMGGWSSEREVSLSSGANCAQALEDRGYRVTRIDVQRNLPDLVAALTPAPDVVFNALHGRYGEDGTIQGVLDILGIPYTHSGVLASALAMNKPQSKCLLVAAGLPCPEGRTIHIDVLKTGHPLPPPYVVKPVNEGSSVGVTIVQPGDNGPDMSNWRFGEEVLVETYIPGREITVAVMDDRALGVTELRPHAGFYDYTAKYTDGKTTHLCPAPIPAEVAQAAMDHAVVAHRALGCRGVSRSDFRYDDSQDGTRGLFILEVNTQPGMTQLSLVPEQAAHAGIGFGELVSWMVENARCDA